MSDLTVLNALLLGAELALASLLLPAAGWLLSPAYRRNAAARRLVWVVVFAMLLAAPLLALTLPTLSVIALPAPATIHPSLAAAPVSVAPPGPRGLSWTVLIPLAGAVWLAGVAKIGVEHLIAAVRLELTRRATRPWTGALPIRVRGCQLRVSEDCPGPMTWGALRPVILLPDAALDWPDARIEAALRHELAHVHRRDGLVQVMSVAACAFYWPNPLVWLAAKALRREAELAADDSVIAAGVRPSDYASQLVELAAEWRERRLTPTGLAMAAPPALSRRVQSILSTDAIRSGATVMDTLKLALLGGVATAAFVLVRPSLAQVAAPAPNPAPQAAPEAAAPTKTIVIKQAQSEKGAQSAPQAAASPPAAQAPPAARGPTTLTVIRESDGPTAAGGVRTTVWLSNPKAPPAPAPAGAPTPAEPPSPPAVAAAPLPPAPPPVPGQPGRRVILRLQPGPDGQLTAEQRAALNSQLAAIGPKIEKALADAHIDDAVAKALKDAHIDETVDKAVKGIQPTIEKSIADAHVREIVAQRLAAVDAAVARAQEDAKHAEEQARRSADGATVDNGRP